MSPSLEVIKDLCEEFQNHWDEDTEIRRRAYPGAGHVVFKPVKTDTIRDSLRWFVGEERWENDTDS